MLYAYQRSAGKYSAFGDISKKKDAEIEHHWKTYQWKIFHRRCSDTIIFHRGCSGIIIE